MEWGGAEAHAVAKATSALSPEAATGRRVSICPVPAADMQRRFRSPLDRSGSPYIGGHAGFDIDEADHGALQWERKSGEP